ncbi:PstA ABC-type phosphate transport system, permease component [actinobacterium SCGC AAA044-D11]
MSTSTTTKMKPTRPWKRTPKQQALMGLNLVVAGLISYLVVLVTPMKGKLAYLAIFFISVIVINFVENYFKSGLAAAKDSIATSFATAGLIIAVVPIFSILYTIFDRGRAGLNFGLFFHDMKANGPNDPLDQGGLLHALVGSGIMVGIALLISLPIGILTAIYLTEIKGIYSRPIKFLVQAMSGVPSIVAGLFILSAIVFPITKSSSGFMGGLALSILMIPTIARTSEEVLLLIPNDLREAGVALGGTQWRTISLIVVPAAKSGLITATILGLARVAGETAPLVLVSGGGDAVNPNPFHAPMGSLPFYIWKGFTYGTTESIARSWAGIFVLLSIIFLLFIAARTLSGSGAKK